MTKIDKILSDMENDLWDGANNINETTTKESLYAWIISMLTIREIKNKLEKDRV